MCSHSRRRGTRLDNATLQKADLERRVEQLVAEIEFLKKIHDEEVAELVRQIEDSKVTAQLDGDRPDLAAYLRNMRAEIEAVAASKVQEAEKWYKGKFDTLKEHAGKHEGQMKSMKEEISVFHSQVSDLQNQRSEERRVGKECLRLCRSRWSPYH